MKALLTHYYLENGKIKKQEEVLKNIAVFKLYEDFNFETWIKIVFTNLEEVYIHFNQNDDEFYVIRDDMEF